MPPILTNVDFVIIAIYGISLVVLGWYLQKRASNSVEDYLVGSRNMPWWMLGFSGMAAFLDVAGTMLIVSFLFMLGPRGLFVELRGGAVLVLIPMMLWAGKWHRRSGVLTGAEWMTFRFGDGFGGRFAQIVKAGSGIILTIGMLGYLIKGIGLFLSTFIPFSPFVCALGLVSLAAIYTMLSGFYGVVLTDFFQSLVILIAVVTITVLAVGQIESLESLRVTAEQVTGNTSWISAAPGWQTEMPTGYDEYKPLLFLAIIYVLRNLFFGLGAGDDPKYFGAKSDAECSKLSILWVSLMTFRWPMMMGFAVLGIYLVNDMYPEPAVIESAATLIRDQLEVDKSNWHTALASLANSTGQEFTGLQGEIQQILGESWREKLPLVGFEGRVDPERVMPMVLVTCIPAGLKGLLLVALIAASMSTFDSEVNKTAGYFARDIYQKYLRPEASTREIILCTWGFILGLVVLGFLFAFSLEAINDVWAWIIMGLGGGLMAPLILRMYWWRFNGSGFAVGTLCGVIGAILQRVFYPDIPEYYALLILASIGFSGSIMGSYLTPAVDPSVLSKFYFRTRPFGFWGGLPGRLPADLREKVKQEHRRDLMAIPFALVFQVSIFLSPMLFLIGQFAYGSICLGLALAGFAGIYFVWLRHIEKADENNYLVEQWCLENEMDCWVIE